jgi:sodium-dependent dicarboxylate transporter 2/3/5
MADNNNLRAAIQWAGLLGGPLLAALCYVLLPTEYTGESEQPVLFSAAGRATLAVMTWMAVWWLTEAIHISATALLPLVLFPMFGIATIADAAAPYANPLIFLFFGGFMLALSMQRWGLDRRIALMTLRMAGPQPIAMIAGFMLITAVLSAFVSNTATTAMMLPIALSVIAVIRGKQSPASGERKLPEPAPRSPADQELESPVDLQDAPENRAADNFTTCLLLGIAYAASVGGVATIIGTPPNAILVGFLREGIAQSDRMNISMARWMLFGVPLAVIFLPIVLVLLTKFIYPLGGLRIAGAKELLRSQLQALGPVGRGEWTTLIVFLCTAALWITRPWLVEVEKQFGGGFQPFAALGDSGIAMLAAIALFVIPVHFGRAQFTMNWETAQRAPWGILILFGGGLSLAEAVKQAGVAEFIGSQASFFAGAPTILVVLVVCAGVIFLTELTSNAATTATLVPVLAALAPGLGVHPYLLIFPATLSASFAFMLPVATPPNAIVFGSGHVTIPQMVKAGLWLNIIGILIITALTMLLVGPVLGLKL